MHSAVVTGGQGFIGRELVKALRRRGVDVMTVGRCASAEPNHIALAQDEWQSPALDRVLSQADPDCVFHLAGRACGNASELFAANVLLTQNLIEALTRLDSRALLVVAGSAAEYGAAIRDGEPVSETMACAPSSAYGASKQAQTRAALAYADETGTPVLVARIFNALGPNMPAHLAIGDFAAQIASMPANRGTLLVGNIDVRRDMVDVEHVATLLCQLAENPRARGVVNVCSGQAPLLRDLVELLIDASGRSIELKIDQSRMRKNEVKTVIGSTDLLRMLGCPPPATDFRAVMNRVYQRVQARMEYAS